MHGIKPKSIIQDDFFPNAATPPVLYGNAKFSCERSCRNELRRWWVEKPERWAAWLMLNPSNAGAEKNDPTMLRVIHFTRAWGYDGAIVVNLYPFITPDPRDMWGLALWDKAVHGPDWYARDAIHHNANYIEAAARAAHIRIVAFGTQPVLRDDLWLEEALEAFGQPADIEGNDENFYCLGATKNGQPIHPMARGKLRITNDQKPVLWRQNV